MQAVVAIPDRREIRVESIPEPPDPQAGEVVVRTLDVGICGTDREIASFTHGGPPDGRDRFVVGHEALGQVLELGPQVIGLARGDLVVPSVRRPCADAQCRPCRAGRSDFCATGEFSERGILRADGFLTERFIETAKNLRRVPATLREVGVLVEPLTVAQKALSELALLQSRLPGFNPSFRPPRDPMRGEGAQAFAVLKAVLGRRPTALVLGAGPVGLLGAFSLAAAGFATLLYSRSPEPNLKADLAAAAGVLYVSSEHTPVEQLLREHGPVDFVYEAAGASKTAFDTLRLLGRNAVFAFTGVPGRKHPNPVDTDQLMRQLVLQNQIVFGTVNASAQHFEAAVNELRLFERLWPGLLERLITAEAELDEAPDAIRGEGAFADKGIKTVVRVG